MFEPQNEKVLITWPQRIDKSELAKKDVLRCVLVTAVNSKIFCTAIISRNLRKRAENSANGIKFERENCKNEKM